MLACVTPVRIAVLCLGLTIAVVSAQTTPPTVLKMQVEDPTGARIPGASIQVRSKTDQQIAELRANSWGEAVVSLDPDQYTLLVRASGFRSYSQVVSVTSHTDQAIKVVLAVGNQCAGCLSIYREMEIELERAVPESSIAPEPLQSVCPPGHKLRMRGRRRPTG